MISCTYRTINIARCTACEQVLAISLQDIYTAKSLSLCCNPLNYYTILNHIRPQYVTEHNLFIKKIAIHAEFNEFRIVT